MESTQIDIDEDLIIEKAEENDCNNVVDLVPFRLGYLCALQEQSKKQVLSQMPNYLRSSMIDKNVSGGKEKPKKNWFTGLWSKLFVE